MFVIDLFTMLADLCEEIRFGKRYGFGSLLWGMAFFAFFVLAVVSLHLEWKVLGIPAILGAAICFFCSCRRAWRDMRKKHIESTKEQA